jgi:hypothetical protein
MVFTECVRGSLSPGKSRCSWPGITLEPGPALDTINACDGIGRQNQKGAREASKLELNLINRWERKLSTIDRKKMSRCDTI